MSEYRDNRPQLFRIFLHHLFSCRNKSIRHDVSKVAHQWSVQLVDLRWKELFEDNLFQDASTIIVVFVVAFDEAPSVYITNIRFAVASQEVEPADILLEYLDYFLCDEFLFWGENDRVSLFFSVLVSLYNTVQAWSLPGFSVHVIWTNSVYFNVETIGSQELLIDVVAISPY